MHVLGFRANYTGQFGGVPVIQAGRFQLIHLKTYERVPLPLVMLMQKAEKAGAQFLVLDPKAGKSEKANWVDIKEAA